MQLLCACVRALRHVTRRNYAGGAAHVDFSSVKRASLDWCPEIAALSASSDAAGQMPTALSAEQLRDLKATLEELEDMYSKLDKAKVCPDDSR